MTVFRSEMLGAAPDVILQLAAQARARYSLENLRSYLESNMVSTFDFRECARELKVGHLLFPATRTVTPALLLRFICFGQAAGALTMPVTKFPTRRFDRFMGSPVSAAALLIALAVAFGLLVTIMIGLQELLHQMLGWLSAGG